MDKKPKKSKANKPTDAGRKDARGAADTELGVLAERIMREDREVLQALADVMTRRKHALRELAK